MHLHPNITELAVWVFITNTLHYNEKIMMIVNFIKALHNQFIRTYSQRVMMFHADR